MSKRDKLSPHVYFVRYKTDTCAHVTVPGTLYHKRVLAYIQDRHPSDVFVRDTGVCERLEDVLTPEQCEAVAVLRLLPPGAELPGIGSVDSHDGEIYVRLGL